MRQEWKTHFKDRLIAVSHAKGSQMAEHYGTGCPYVYMEETAPETAVSDIKYLEELSKDNPLNLHLLL